MNFGILYIDPSATSILFSSATAIIVACGATFIIMWRKLKKGAKTVLHIDENANKEVEAELVISDEESAEAPPAESTEAN